MGLAYGIAAAAVQLGVGAVLVKPKRGIGPFSAHVTISERHTDELEITDHPVEQGAQITDHAFKRPPEVVIECAWSDSPKGRGGFLGNVAAGLVPNLGFAGQVVGSLATGAGSILSGNDSDQVRDVYAKLLALQDSRILFDVFTGKRVYRDMLLKVLTVETDKDRENILSVTAVCRQVQIASVRVVNVSAPREDMADPEATLGDSPKGVKQLAAPPKTLNLSAAIDSLTPSGLEGL